MLSINGQSAMPFIFLAKKKMSYFLNRLHSFLHESLHESQKIFLGHKKLK